MLPTTSPDASTRSSAPTSPYWPIRPPAAVPVLVTAPLALLSAMPTPTADEAAEPTRPPAVSVPLTLPEAWLLTMPPPATGV